MIEASAEQSPTMDSMFTLKQIEVAALAGLSPAVADFLQGGTGDETTLRWNREAFDRFAFRPRLMSGNGVPELSTTFLGEELALPVLTAPFGSDGLFSPAGHSGVVRADATHGISGIVPEVASESYETVRASAPSGARFAQLHPLGSEQNFLTMLRRIEAAGYRGICVTCDSPSAGWKERNRRNRFAVPEDIISGNYSGPGSAEVRRRVFEQLFSQSEPVWSWSKLARLMATSTLPWFAKGIITVADTRAALDAGASGLYISNHGGRQLDRTPSPLDILPAIREAVGLDVDIAVDIAVDSGIRRGSDVAATLALGGTVAVIGRLAVYGLAAGGEAGVSRVLELLRDEIKNVLMLLGCDKVLGLDASALFPMKGSWP